MKLTKRQIVYVCTVLLSGRNPWTIDAITEWILFIEEHHTLKTLEAMLNDGKYIEPKCRTIYNHLIMGGL